ncbi:MAG: hypothetical protein RMY36_013150 [Nostoc sp. SerVER01]|nr:hypothetical protein [Nostoc sp. SerVER01]
MVPKSYQRAIEEVCILLPKDNPELKGKNRCAAESYFSFRKEVLA